MKISSLTQLLVLAVTLGSGLAAHTAHAAALPSRVSGVFIEPDKFTDALRIQNVRSDAAFADQIFLLQGFHDGFDIRLDRRSNVLRLRGFDRAGPDDFVLA